MAHLDGVLQADLESSEVFSEVEETPAEAVAKNPGPALMAAREVGRVKSRIQGRFRLIF